MNWKKSNLKKFFGGNVLELFGSIEGMVTLAIFMTYNFHWRINHISYIEHHETILSSHTSITNSNSYCHSLFGHSHTQSLHIDWLLSTSSMVPEKLKASFSEAKIKAGYLVLVWIRHPNPTSTSYSSTNDFGRWLIRYYSLIPSLMTFITRRSMSKSLLSPSFLRKEHQMNWASLLTNPFKVISKVLANRLQHKTHLLVH